MQANINNIIIIIDRSLSPPTLSLSPPPLSLPPSPLSLSPSLCPHLVSLHAGVHERRATGAVLSVDVTAFPQQQPHHVTPDVIARDGRRVHERGPLAGVARVDVRLLSGAGQQGVKAVDLAAGDGQEEVPLGVRA